jgi:hypothetical protein
MSIVCDRKPLSGNVHVIRVPAWTPEETVCRQVFACRRGNLSTWLQREAETKPGAGFRLATTKRPDRDADRLQEA